ncbi:MAG: hypothetical protein ACRBDL_03650 [Alphaproteobacteria bacterium]
MKTSPLQGIESVKVTVHFDDISAKEALSLGRDFRKISKDMGLYVAQPNKFDHLQYTDLHFRVPEQPDGWENTFITALDLAVKRRGWIMDDQDDTPTVVTSTPA